MGEDSTVEVGRVGRRRAERRNACRGPRGCTPDGPRARRRRIAMETFVLAGGCFWCLDAVYRSLDGVSDVVSGYTGGRMRRPSYEMVCTGMTGHAEAVAVTFDPDVIPREVILGGRLALHHGDQLNPRGDGLVTQFR